MRAELMSVSCHPSVKGSKYLFKYVGRSNNLQHTCWLQVHAVMQNLLREDFTFPVGGSQENVP
jgi:hypothetical protein